MIPLPVLPDTPGISMMAGRSASRKRSISGSTWADVTGEIVNLGFMFLLTGLVGTIVMTAYVILGAKLFKVDFSIMKGFDVEKMGEDSKHLRPRAKRIIIVYVIIMLLSMTNKSPSSPRLLVMP